MTSSSDRNHGNYFVEASGPPTKGQRASVQAPPLAQTPGMAKLPPSLEALPTEILHAIFWESLEINLIFTSQRIACRLPDLKSTARILMLLAYSRAEAWTLLPLSRAELIPLRSELPLTLAQRVQLQRSIMKGDWLTVDMLKNTLLEIIEGYIRMVCTKRKIATLGDLEGAFPHVWKDIVRLREIQLCVLHTEDPGFIDEIGFYGSCWMGKSYCDHHCCGYSLLDVAHIPDKLLEPPFNHRKIELLLVILGARYHEHRYRVIDMSRSILETGIREAIEQGNSDVALLLVDLAFRCLDRYIQPADFELAAKCDHSDTLERLVSFDSFLFPRDNRCIERWAKAARDLGSRFGYTLHEYMLAESVLRGMDSFTRFQRYRWPRYAHGRVSFLMRRNGALACVGPKYGLLFSSA